MALAAYSVFCLLYRFSRGGYAAFLAGRVFRGIMRQRILLVLLVVFLLVWTAVVPNAVKMRMDVTYDESSGEIDHSSQMRVEMWDDAMALFAASPVLGTGFYTYAFMHRVLEYQDPHNFFVKVLLETGILGMLIFRWLLLRFSWVGLRFSRRARDPFFAGWVVTSVVANFFGDRWTFLQVNGYLWVIAGLVARAMAIDWQPQRAANLESAEPASTRAAWFAEALA